MSFVEEISPALEVIKEQVTKKSKAEKDAAFRKLYEEGMAASLAAGNAGKPTPMVVSGMGKTYFVSEGVCGFAWVNVRPGFSPFAKWLLKNCKNAHKSYAGGVDVSIWDFNQSYERKMAGARAMAEVFRNAGIAAYSNGRLD